MAAEHTGLRIEDFLGINRSVASEDLQDQFYHTSQNIYERKVGELQRRGGAEEITTLPSNIIAIDNVWTLNDRFIGKKKIAKVTCQRFPTDLSFPQISASFVTSPAGQWGLAGPGSPATLANSYIGADEIVIAAAGFGGMQTVYTLDGSSVSLGDTKTLQIVLSSDLGNDNVVELMVFAQIRSWFVDEFGVPNPVSQYVHIGSIGTTAGTYNIKSGPLNLVTATATEINTGSNATFSVASATGGSLSEGKTYYVAVLTQKIRSNGSGWIGPQWNYWTASAASSVTIDDGDSAISLDISVGGISSMVAIGTHPFNMRVVGIITNSTDISPVTITSLDAISGYDFKTSCAVVAANYNSDGTLTYGYRLPDIPAIGYTSNADLPVIPYHDAFISVDSSGNVRYLPVNNFQRDYNLALQSVGQQQTNNPAAYYSIRTGLSYEGSYEAVQHPHSTADLLFALAGTGTAIASGTAHQGNLVQCDGYSVNMAPVKYVSGGAGSLNNGNTPPKCRYIASYKGRLVIAGGGDEGYTRAFYNATIFDPYTWKDASNPNGHYVEAQRHEGISGIGIYTNTSGTSGPVAQLIITKPNSLHLLTDFPSAAGGTLTELSGRVGCANHRTIVNTDIGTILTSDNNVWLIRESGEPTPLGDAISTILKPEDPSVGLNTSYWNAVYHDSHYKLAYSVNGAAAPTKELWLDIRKMKLMKGQPCWQGPHTGRTIYGSCVEERLNDTEPAKRYCAGTTLYQADKEDVTDDLGTAITCEFETRNFPLGEPNANKLLTQTTWKVKADETFSATEVTTVLNDNGEESETQTLTFDKITSHTGGSYSTFLAARVKKYDFFSTGRLRGETIRKKLTYSGDKRFALSGFTIFFKEERRRVR